MIKVLLEKKVIRVIGAHKVQLDLLALREQLDQQDRPAQLDLRGLLERLDLRVQRVLLVQKVRKVKRVIGRICPSPILLEIFS